jgi:hypothetical protein
MNGVSPEIRITEPILMKSGAFCSGRRTLSEAPVFGEHNLSRAANYNTANISVKVHPFLHIVMRAMSLMTAFKQHK